MSDWKKDLAQAVRAGNELRAKLDAEKKAEKPKPKQRGKPKPCPHCGKLP
jgi:hypothetical protein